MHGHSFLCKSPAFVCVGVFMCRVSLCWTRKVIAAFVDCWQQVLSHLVTAGKREGWRLLGHRSAERRRKGWMQPSINHTWLNSRHRGDGSDKSMVRTRAERELG